MAYCLLQPGAVATAGFSGSGGGARWNQKEIYFSFCWVKRKCQVVVCRAWLRNARYFAPTSALLQGNASNPISISPASSFFVASLCLIALPPPPEPHLPPPPDHGFSLLTPTSHHPHFKSKIRWVLGGGRRISESPSSCYELALLLVLGEETCEPFSSITSCQINRSDL